MVEGFHEKPPQEPTIRGSPGDVRASHESPPGTLVDDRVFTHETGGSTFVDEALHERVTQEPSTSGRSHFDSPIHTSEEYIPGMSPPNFTEWMDSRDVSSFSSVQNIIKKKFLAFQ